MNSVLQQIDFDNGWFDQHGSLGKSYELFSDRLNVIITELNEGLVA